MSEVERILLARRLAGPSAELERRMAESFAAARRRRQPLQPRLGWWSFASLAAVIALAFLTLPSRSVRRTAESLVYRVEAPELLREMLLDFSRDEELSGFKVKRALP